MLPPDPFGAVPSQVVRPDPESALPPRFSHPTVCVSCGREKGSAAQRSGLTGRGRRGKMRQSRRADRRPKSAGAQAERAASECATGATGAGRATGATGAGGAGSAAGAGRRAVHTHVVKAGACAARSASCRLPLVYTAHLVITLGNLRDSRARTPASKPQGMAIRELPSARRGHPTQPPPTEPGTARGHRTSRPTESPARTPKPNRTAPCARRSHPDPTTSPAKQWVERGAAGRGRGGATSRRESALPVRRFWRECRLVGWNGGALTGLELAGSMRWESALRGSETAGRSGSVLCPLRSAGPCEGSRGRALPE